MRAGTVHPHSSIVGHETTKKSDVTFLSFSVCYFLFSFGVYILMCLVSLSTPTPFSVHACVSLVNHPLCVKVSVAPSLLVGSSVLPLSFHNCVHTYPCPIFPV